MSLLSNFLKRQSSHPLDVQLNEHQIVPMGQLLSNRYLVTETLGRGAMGEVYLAEDTVLGGVSVAIKVISQTLPSKQLLDKFAREAQIGAFLGHHNVNIVRVLDFGVHNDEIPFYVMEYIYGTTLADEIAQHPLSLNRCLKLMSQVCAGLQSAHQGVLFEKKLYSVIHRDLKPGNIFITSNSSFGEIAKILDFGIAEFLLPTHKSTEAEAMGTLAYASSEQLLGQKLEPSADIYSLGITMFEALTGQLPIVPAKNTVSDWIDAHCKRPPRRLREVAPHCDFPESLETLIQQCLHKKPRKRPQMIQEVLDSLEQIAAQTSGSVNSPVKSPSHDDVLDELFSDIGAAPAYSARQYPEASRTPQTTRHIASENRANETVRLQASAPPLSPQQTLADSPLALAQRAPWPANKPIAEIVFAQSLKSPHIEQAALWAMLHNAKIQQQALPRYRIEFTVEVDPHPMLAWVTILHDEKGRMRCLPCFLDLVNPSRQRLIQTLAEEGKYLFLLFDPSDSTQPAKISSLTLDSRQRQQLQQSVSYAIQYANTQTITPGLIAISKKKLKVRYKSLKSKLQQKLTTIA